jgi:predicted small lipoprotein YifL
MNREPIGWLPGILLALAIAAVLSLAACGGGGGGEEQSPTPADETAAVESEELDPLMLQAEDLPEGFSYDITSDVRPLTGMEEPQERTAGRHLRSLLEESQQAEGKTVCIVSDLELYANAEAASARLAEEWQAIEAMAAGLPAEQGVPEKLDLPAIGDEASGFFLSAPRVTFCGWEAVQAEVVSLTFRKGELLADVRTYTLGQGALTDQAIELARKLLARIEAGLGEQ